MLAFATGEGYDIQPNSRKPFHGYYFRMLHKQGSHAQGGAKDYLANGQMVNGFAFVAYPAEYAISGIMTFMVNQNDVVYEKNLGKTTVEAATTMDEFDPDNSWTHLD